MRDDQSNIALEIIAIFTNVREVTSPEGNKETIAAPHFLVDYEKIPTAIQKLKELTGKGNDIDPFATLDENAWTILVSLLSNYGQFQISIDLILIYIDLLYELQEKENVRIDKSRSFFWASLMFERGQKENLAKSYMILSFIEDALKIFNTKLGMAHTRLNINFKYSDEELSELSHFVNQIQLSAGAIISPEELFVRFEYTNKSFQEVVLPFNRIVIRKWGDSIFSQVPNLNDGIELEIFSCYLFQTIPGNRLVVRRLGSGGEIDIVISNVDHTKSRDLPWNNEYFFIECKDRKGRVSSEQLAHFASKMSLTKTNVGILISRSELTGAGKNRGAEQIRRLVFSQSNLVIINITLSQIKSIKGYNGFMSLLLREYENVRLGKQEW